MKSRPTSRLNKAIVETLETRQLLSSYIYSNDFSSGAGSEWSKPTVTTSPSGQHLLGEFGGGNNGTATGGYTWVAGHAGSGSALQFDGSTGYVTMEPDDTLMFSGNVTVSAWVKFGATPTTSVIVDDVPSTGGGGFRLGVNNGKAYFEVRDSGNNVYSTASVSGGTSLAANTWYHVTGILNNGAVSTYIDNALDRQNGTSGTMAQGATQTILVGRERGTPSNYLNGTLDDLQIFNRALTGSDILQLPTGPTNGLIAYLNFDEGSGTKAYDSANAAGVKLSLNDLPAHTSLTVSFDLDIIRSWDGRAGVATNGPDIWSLTEDGNSLIQTTFANGNSSGQSYPGSYPGGNHPKQTGAVTPLNALGYLYNGTPMDATYHLTYTFSHSSPTVVLNFFGSKLQGLLDESWGIDNVTVTSTPATPVISGDPSANEGSIYTLHLYSGTSTVSGWNIDWGDSSSSTITGDPSTVTHTYVDNGSYTVSGSATYSGSVHSVPAIIATILNVAPNLTISASSTVQQDLTYQLNLSSSDPGQDTISSWAINWGDGTAVQTFAGSLSTVSHVFLSAGSPTISATATDEDGTYSSNTQAVSVTGPQPGNPIVLPSPAPGSAFHTPDGNFNMEVGPQTLVFDFDKDVVVGSNALEVHNLNTKTDVTQLTLSGSGAERIYTVDSTGSLGEPHALPAGNYDAVLNADLVSAADGGGLLDGNRDGIGDDDYITSFFFLPGDTNHDRSVDGTDYAAVNAAFGTSATGYHNGDFDYNGHINADDYFIIDDYYGTVLPAPPAAANTVTASAATGESRIDLTWTAPTGALPDGYHVYRSTDGGVSFSLYATVSDGHTTNWSDGDVSEGTKYSYRIRAFTAALGESETTNKVSAVTNLPGPVDAPTATDVGPHSLTLHWTDNSDDETGFEIVQTNPDGTNTTYSAAANATSYPITGLSPETAYTFKVRAVTAAQQSMLSQGLTVTTADDGTPKNLTATALTDSSIQLIWIPPSSSVDGYRVWRSDGTSVDVNNPTATSWSDTGLDDDADYTYQVSSYVNGLDSPMSNEATCPEPQIVTVSLPDSGHAFEQDSLPATFIISRSSDASSAMDVSYTMSGSATNGVDYDTLSGTAHFNAGDSSTSVDLTPIDSSSLAGAESVTLTLQPPSGTTYVVGSSASSASATIYDKGDSTITAPASVDAEGQQDEGEQAVVVSWDSVANANFYLVERANNSSFTQGLQQFEVSGPDNNFTDSDAGSADTGTTFYYRVLAVTDAGTSPWSTSTHADTPAPLPASPDGLYAVPISDTQVQLTWNNRSDSATSFLVQRATDDQFTQDLTSVTVDNAPTEVSISGDYEQSAESSVLHAFGNLSFPGWQSDDLGMLLGADESVQVTSSPIAGGTHYTVTLPDDAILINNTSGAWGDNSGSDTLTLVQGSNTFTPTGDFQISELQQHGFSTRDASTGVTAAEMNQWIGTDGSAQYKLAVIGDTPWINTGIQDSSPSYVDTPSADGTYYYYRIYAENSDGQSAHPTTTMSAVLPLSAPVQPVSEVATDSTGTEIEWGDESSNETAFEIYRSTAADFSEDVTLIGRTRPNVTVFEDPAATDSSYYYQVVAVNAYTGSSELSEAPGIGAPAIVTAARQAHPALWFVASDGTEESAGGATSAQKAFMDNGAVNVFIPSGQLSKFGFNPLTCRITWNFGDTGSLYNDELNGFNASHLYRNTGATAETYNIVATIQDPTRDGQAFSTATLSVTIPPASTHVMTVSPSSDAGAQIATQLATWKALGFTKNLDILFEDGETYDISSTIRFVANPYLYIGSVSGNGSNKPTLIWQGSTGTKSFFNFDAASNNVTVENLSFNSSSTSTAKSLNVFNLQANNLSLVDCQIGHMEGLEADSNMHGLLMQGNMTADLSDNSPDLTKQIAGYFLEIYGGASDIVLLGNRCNGAVLADVRFSYDTQRGFLYDNTLTMQRLNTQPNGTIRVGGGGYFYIENNHLGGSASSLGPLIRGRDTPEQTKTDVVIFDSNIMSAFPNYIAKTNGQSTAINGDELELQPGLTHAVIRNNIFEGTSRINLLGDTEANGKISQQIWIVNNTRLDATIKKFLQFSGPSWTPAPDTNQASSPPPVQAMQYVNLHVANNLEARSHLGSPAIWAGDGISLDPIGPKPGSLQPDPGTLWHEELLGELPSEPQSVLNAPNQKSRWWIADNIWSPQATFSVDTGTASPLLDYIGWNAFNGEASQYADRVVSHGGVYVDNNTNPASGAPDPTYLPIGTAANYGSRTILGPNELGQELQVAAWDYWGNERPLVGSTQTPFRAGAVQDVPPAP